MRFSFKSHPRPTGPSRPIAVLMPERRLGVWSLREPLHASAAGQWYRAEHAVTGAQQAALIIFERPADAAALMLRFAEETDELSRLEHHGVVTPFDSGLTQQGQPFMVLPWVEGLRPAWLIRLGLFLYDHMGGRKLLPPTCTLAMKSDPAGKPLN